MRRMDIWSESSSPVDFAFEFLQDPSTEVIHEGRQASGKLGSTEMDARVSVPIWKDCRSAFPSFTDDGIAFSVTFHEAWSEREANGEDGLDTAIAELAVTLSLDERFTHGVLAEDQQSSCMYFWSPAGRWLVNMDLPLEGESLVTPVQLQSRGIQRQWADRTARHFRPRVERLLDEAGVWCGYRTFEWDWPTRRTVQHSFDRLAAEEPTD